MSSQFPKSEIGTFVDEFLQPVHILFGQPANELNFTHMAEAARHGGGKQRLHSAAVAVQHLCLTLFYMRRKDCRPIDHNSQGQSHSDNGGSWREKEDGNTEVTDF